MKKKNIPKQPIIMIRYRKSLKEASGSFLSLYNNPVLKFYFNMFQNYKETNKYLHQKLNETKKKSKNKCRFDVVKSLFLINCKMAM